MSKLIEGKTLPAFRPGDSVNVLVKVFDGSRERMQSFEGVIISRKRRGINSSFRVRKISNGEGVERLFHLYSPNIQIKIIKHGKVRRGKLYYLRNRTGKGARIAERKRINAA
jgi:large subunit ribosomal protein L19